MSSLLFDSYKSEAFHFKHRLVMAPMTRCRASRGRVPNELMATYYAQRASAALIVSEATGISAQGEGYSFTPGIYTDEQLNGWKIVTEKVHKVGGKIFCQVWHCGRMSHDSLHNGAAPVAPSPIETPEGITVWVGDEDSREGGMKRCSPPRELTLSDIEEIKQDFYKAAVNIKKAGFDGVELHGGNGYLIDQFMRSTSNQRTDKYGGSDENLIRFPLEVVDEFLKVFSPEQVGVRIAPHNMARGMNDPHNPERSLLLLKELNKKKIAYIHFAEVDWDEVPDVPEEYRKRAREAFEQTIIVAGKYDVKKADWVLERNYADLVAMGRPFIANPDLAYRLETNSPLAELNPDTLLGGTEVGYTDYKTLNKEL